MCVHYTTISINDAGNGVRVPTSPCVIVRKCINKKTTLFTKVFHTYNVMGTILLPTKYYVVSRSRLDDDDDTMLLLQK